jgi:hypothetical protein
MRCVAVICALSGLAMVVAGCSDSHFAASNAAMNSGGNQPASYQAGYGLSSEGTTTDLYTELKGSLQRPERPQAAASVQQPVSAGVNGQQVAAANPGAAQASNPPQPGSTASVYGMSSEGPTTDVYSALFGSRDR